MLYLSATQSQALNVTLRDVYTIYTYYTWKIRNSMTNEETIFTQDNSSSSPYYQTFTLSVSSPQGLTSGVVDVDPGQYQYFIYGSLSPYNLDVTGLEEIETGILNILGPITELTEYEGNATYSISAYTRNEY